jgi:hypothetical protein
MAGAIARVTNTNGTGSLVASAIVLAAPGTVQEIVCTNTSAGVLYCQVFNSTTLPANATTPDFVFAVPATSTASWDAQQGVHFDTGIVVCVSTTAHTKTIATAVAVFNTILEA